MSCRNREYEMSLSLDGRLPSGKRATLLRHVASCRQCGSLWRDMLAARELARELPTYGVGSEFREDLRRRIAAGEGAPEAIYRDPLPGGTRVRYLATGAAAAAVLIVAFNMFFKPGTLVVHQDGPVAESTPDPDEAENVESVKVPDGLRAEKTTDGNDGNDGDGNDGRLAPRSSWVPVSEAILADRGTRHLERHAQELRSKYQLAQKNSLAAPEAWVHLERPAKELRAGIEIIRFFENRKIITMEPPLREAVRLADESMRHVFNAKATWEERWVALDRINRNKLDVLLRNNLGIRCCRPDKELIREVKELTNLPGARRVFRIQVLNDNTLSKPGSLEIRATQKPTILIQMSTR